MKIQITIFVAVLFYSISQAQFKPEWQKKSNYARGGACKAVTYKGKIYVTSTTDIREEKWVIIEEYDPDKDIWIPKKAKSNYINGGEYCLAATDSGIYIMGGYSNKENTNHVERYIAEKDTFFIEENMPVGLDCAVAASSNNIIYVMGGRTNGPAGTPFSNKVYTYNVTTKAWGETESLAYGRLEAYAVASDDKIYLAGGYRSSNNTDKEDLDDFSLQVYDLKTGKWEPDKYNVLGSKRGYRGLGIIKNELHILSGGGGLQEVLKFDTLTRSATKIASRSYSAWLLATASYNDSIFFIGGHKEYEFPIEGKLNTTTLFRLVPEKTGIQPLTKDKQGISCFYNKTNQRICLNNLPISKTSALFIVNMSGVSVIQRQLKGEQAESVDVANLPKGIYTVVYNNQSFKLIIN